MARRLFRDPRERMQERAPRTGPPVANQKGMSEAAPPMKRPFVMDRTGGPTGRPRELLSAARQAAVGPPTLQMGKAMTQEKPEERQPLVGPPQAVQPEKPKPKEKEAAPEEQQIVDPKTKRPVQPMGQAVQQILGGKEPKAEFTVTRNLDVKEIQNAPDGIINTPNAMIEKEATGRIRLRGLTELGRERIEKARQAQLKDFGAWPGADDPSAPPPPVRPGGHSFNPFTGTWVRPRWVIAGETSLLDTLGGL